MYDKNRTLENIYFLAKKNGVKIGDLARESGVSKGYFSRAQSANYQKSPNIEVLDAISRRFGVTIDFLVNLSTDMVDAEQLVMRFTDKLMRKTLAGELQWRNWMTEKAPAFLAANPTKGSLSQTYHSKIYKGDARITGASYCAKLEGVGDEVYLNHVRYVDSNSRLLDDAAIEVFLLSKEESSPVCSSYFVSDGLKKELENLYAAVSKVLRGRIVLEESMRAAIEKFLEGPCP